MRTEEKERMGAHASSHAHAKKSLPLLPVTSKNDEAAAAVEKVNVLVGQFIKQFCTIERGAYVNKLAILSAAHHFVRDSDVLSQEELKKHVDGACVVWRTLCDHLNQTHCEKTPIEGVQSRGHYEIIVGIRLDKWPQK